MYMSRFEESDKVKFEDVLNAFTKSSYSMSLSCESAIADACPIWKILGISKEEYYVKYPPVDVSGNVLENDNENKPETQPAKDLKRT